MKLYFRYDRKHRLYLIFASNIKSDDVVDNPDLPFRPVLSQHRKVNFHLVEEQKTHHKTADAVVAEVI